jgi:hypothetical protein
LRPKGFINGQCGILFPYYLRFADMQCSAGGNGGDLEMAAFGGVAPTVQKKRTEAEREERARSCWRWCGKGKIWGVIRRDTQIGVDYAA